jgi:decaprenylphospho-beta-D-ribofuranose 2-oxidase
MTMLSGWGNYPRASVRMMRARGADEVLSVIRANDRLIARGNGRAYGDPALNSHATLSMLRSDRILDFDAESGRLTCEAGLLLEDLLRIFLPRGWFVPVTPGTKYVTIGGMIAADVHGKNHHRAGSFGRYVESLDLALADGRVLRCSAQENSELLAATCGGMGLTGVILAATFRLMRVRTGFIREETLRAGHLAEAMALFEESQEWTHTVAWIDCLTGGAALGRSLIYRGEHALPDELPAVAARNPLAVAAKRQIRVPFYLPGFILNRWTVRAFNELYHRRNRPRTAIVDCDTFFYPLDSIADWNRIYGRGGFLQYQCVLPKAASAAGITLLLQRIAQSGQGSFLAVLKLFGAQENGLLSFPMEGYALALDFMVSPANLALLAELDAIVADHGGRLYLAKDARTSAAMIRRGYPRLDAFRDIRRRIDPTVKFSSLQSERLGL